MARFALPCSGRHLGNISAPTTVSHIGMKSATLVILILTFFWTFFVAQLARIRQRSGQGSSHPPAWLTFLPASCPHPSSCPQILTLGKLREPSSWRQGLPCVAFLIQTRVLEADSRHPVEKKTALTVRRSITKAREICQPHPAQNNSWCLPTRVAAGTQ